VELCALGNERDVTGYEADYEADYASYKRIIKKRADFQSMIETHD